MSTKKAALAVAISGLALGASQLTLADAFAEALTTGKASGDIRIRYENVEADPEGGDANSTEMMTVRTRLGYKTGDVSGFSAFLEFEDVTDMFGMDDANIPDPEVTEIDQAFIQYKSGGITAKLGTQVITLDGHRHVGHVGWRQDRQTFDAFRVSYAASEDLSIDAIHIYQRNRIFGETADADSSDYLLNIGYNTPIGKFTGYAYSLDDERVLDASDTFGASLTGSYDLSGTKLLYAVEYATQSITDQVGQANEAEYDTSYSLLELGATFSGITAKAGYEILGSDDGAASFTTPLATLHKFNGWADIFLGGTFNPTAMPLGLEDQYLSVSGAVSGVKLAAVYHTYSANEGSADYGSELDLVASTKFGKIYNGGIKYAMYSDDGYNGGTDINKLWLWVGAAF